ncbi:type I restriction enzyme, S subunit [Burkholderia sp. WP9]|uniref:restriction endonuclease subunit S n=1 Tax=Burkholderia sp. WP9 TaxID=1500263 RepID=UPI000896CF6E|nr:restriction endonuclease subunit S [Burkholderia sp. WP9]SEB61384.1 type I restriction enzyme, S subunit [Burkholderia sp. WP9]
MSLSRYREYKDSGHEWLAEVPQHWNVKRVKRLVSSIEQGWSPQCENWAVDGEDEWGVLKVGCVNGGVFNPLENKKLPSELTAIPELGIAQGDLLISRANTRELVGSAAVATKDYRNLLLCDKLYRLRLQSEQCTPHFLSCYLGIEEVRGQIELAATGASSSMLNIGQSVILELPVPLPPFKEQLAIAAFLDRETSMIDTLISEQEKLLTLLAEKRQAVISHAVARGLNPDAPKKDSGVAWLGDVPVHWEVVGLTKYLESVVDYRGRTPTKVDEGVFLVTAKNIRDGVIDYESSKEYIGTAEYDEVMRRGLPKVGDVLFTTEAPLGQVALVDREDIALAQRVIKFRGESTHLDNRFLKFWIMGDACQFNLAQLATGSTALGIKGSKIGQVRLCLPPLDEQAAIVGHIERNVVELDALKTEAERAVELLKERRSALISAAVTGKIDVRGQSLALEAAA